MTVCGVSCHVCERIQLCMCVDGVKEKGREILCVCGVQIINSFHSDTFASMGLVASRRHDNIMLVGLKVCVYVCKWVMEAKVFAPQAVGGCVAENAKLEKGEKLQLL